MTADALSVLAMSMDANRGVYALLVGSGLSSSAGIPTGYQITLDLIRRIAAGRGDICDPDPERWLKDTLGIEPEYSTLLEQLGPTSAERQAVLRGYFEPTDEERAGGIKQPTVAHQVIARLVRDGYIKIIITPNFDPLLEQALRAVGVEPVVVSTVDAIKGMQPIQHHACVVVKVNGDYLDTRIRNTAGELEKYEPEAEELLDQIFDEYGLTVCGWSARWDAGLRAAMERCPSHRYTTYYTLRREPNEHEAKLIAQRRAAVIQIESADDFFTRLDRALAALTVRRPGEVSTGALTTPAGAGREVTRFLSDPRHRIDLRALVMGQAQALAEAIGTGAFPSQAPQPTAELYAERVAAYDGLSETAARIMATGCYWAEGEQVQNFVDMLRTVANPESTGGGYTVWIALQHYPALLLLYAGGIAAVAAGRMDTFYKLLTGAEVRDPNGDRPAALGLAPFRVMDQEATRQLPTQSGPRLLVPESEHLFTRVRDATIEVVPVMYDYDRFFDRYEILSALIQIDLSMDGLGGGYGYIGRFGYKNRLVGFSAVAGLREEIQMGPGWPLLEAGAFGGDPERLNAVLDRLEESARRMPW